MRREDGRLLAQLILLDRQLPGIIEELLAGTLDGAEREALALTLTTIAAQLDPDLLLTDKATPGEPSRAQPNAERLRPAGPTHLVRGTFSNSGPGPSW